METFIIIALVCKEVIGIVSFGPLLIPGSIEHWVKWTQLLPLERNELAEKSLRSEFGTTRTSSRLRVPAVFLFCFIGMYMVPMLLQRTM